MSILVALFIVLNAIKNLKKSLDVFLMKAPSGVDIDELAEHILEVDGVLDVHHFHLWSMDGYNSCAMMHIVADGDVKKVKEEVKEEPKKPVPAPEKKTKTKSEAKPQPAAVATQGSLFGTMVEDIRQAISLGDRFLFQRELFDGNGELMQQALDELNELYTLNEALEYINEHFEWDKESTAAQLFENVLKRRFAN
jgi:hypothetical protein